MMLSNSLQTNQNSIMVPDRITIGSIEFENVRNYSQKDKVRDTYQYEAKVYGIDVKVYKYKSEDNVKLKFLSTSKMFTNIHIKPELACKAALRMLLEAITTASDKLKEDLK